jgi:alginate O-acetyltransferase complex protein AlgI
MLFNSLTFAVFLPIVFILYWFVFSKKIKWQNLLIVVSSYIFYGWWDWRFLGLIIFSTLLDYSVGRALSNQVKLFNRKLLLSTSILINLGLLGVIKYYNFFLDSLYDAAPGLQAILGFNTLSIILPVGISFYTFQTLSYTIDIYKKRLNPTKDFVAFAAFVSFFPQLVAGPIERATNLLPQFYNSRKFDYSKSVDGLRQILWGLFKKMVIADNCAKYANLIFNDSHEYGGSTLFLGAIFFSFQIYGDFSGYSDIAIGTSRLFGFNLMQNFAFPYFSRDIAEFWRRWHISLSTWFRDYLYIPLGGSRGGLWMKIRNTFIIFIVSGFWHGANWTFIIWGLLNALYFLPLLLIGNNRNNLGVVAENKIVPSIREFISILVTFSLTVLAWIFFRAENVHHALEYIAVIFSISIFDKPEFLPLMVFLLLLFFLLIEWIGRKDQYGIEKFGLSKPSVFRWSFYIILAMLIFLFKTSEQEFIYFQF